MPKAQVIKAYTAQYPNPISFQSGAVVEIKREDPEYPGWFWCRASAGREGWVHRSFLAKTVGKTTSLAAYSARELTVLGGERGTSLQSLDGWIYMRLDSGDEGWLPESCVQLSPV